MLTSIATCIKGCAPCAVVEESVSTAFACTVDRNAGWGCKGKLMEENKSGYEGIFPRSPKSAWSRKSQALSHGEQLETNGIEIADQVTHQS